MRKKEIKKKIGILTSGGDAPGMNAVIRAIVRTAEYYKDIQILGIRRGYEGLLSADFKQLKSADVSDIIHRGGTILRTARCLEMMNDDGIAKAAQICKVLNFDALIVIGGDGTLTGASKLAEQGVNVIGIPGTIDLDLACSEYTIGFDTAVNTGMEAIEKLRDTSGSHERCSVVEVMGRGAGDIALWCAMTGGAEEVLIPENPSQTKDDIIHQIIENRAKGKNHHLILVAEGASISSFQLSKEIEKITAIEARATILGHLQRGGNPTAIDRFHASMMGYMAIDVFKNNKKNKIIIFKGGKYEHIDIFEGLKQKRDTKNHFKMYEISKILSI